MFEVFGVFSADSSDSKSLAVSYAAFTRAGVYDMLCKSDCLSVCLV